MRNSNEQNQQAKQAQSKAAQSKSAQSKTSAKAGAKSCSSRPCGERAAQSICAAWLLPKKRARAQRKGEAAGGKQKLYTFFHKKIKIVLTEGRIDGTINRRTIYRASHR